MVEVSLQKQDGMHWWSRVLKTDEPINTQKVGLARHLTPHEWMIR